MMYWWLSYHRFARMLSFSYHSVDVTAWSDVVVVYQCTIFRYSNQMDDSITIKQFQTWFKDEWMIKRFIGWKGEWMNRRMIVWTIEILIVQWMKKSINKWINLVTFMSFT